GDAGLALPNGGPGRRGQGEHHHRHERRQGAQVPGRTCHENPSRRTPKRSGLYGAATRNATFSGHTAAAVLRRLTIALALALAVITATAGATPKASAATSPCGRTKTIPAWDHIIVI